ncbi:MAG: hypothetical protein ACHQ1E_00145 [Ktedonobacterales bacterium]|jgi:hypothetical protein
MIDRLRAVIAAAEQLPENEQEQLAALWEETLRDNVRWRTLFQHPGSAAFFEQLRAEAAEAERQNMHSGASVCATAGCAFLLQNGC